MSSESANAPYLRNAWYVGAWDYELDKGILARTIMDEPIAFFRDASGKVGAVEDRCCHRGAALTDGKVIETGLQCGYHGLVFNGKGQCVEIPGQDAIPPMAKIKSYPIVEKQEFVWIWMGDPALADESKIIDWPYHKSGANPLPHCKDVMPFKANYLMLIDKVYLVSYAFIILALVRVVATSWVGKTEDNERLIARGDKMFGVGLMLSYFAALGAIAYTSLGSEVLAWAL